MTQQWKPTWEDTRFNHLPTSCLVQWQAQKLGRFPSGEGKRCSPMFQGGWQQELTHSASVEGPPFQPRPAAAPAPLPLSLRPIHGYFWSFNNCCMVVLQEQSLFSPEEPNVPAGEWGRRAGMSALHSLSASKGSMINGKPQEPADQDNWNGEAALRGLSVISQGQSNCYQTCSRANLGYQIITAHSWQ